jgi:hypothetical protein
LNRSSFSGNEANVEVNGKVGNDTVQFSIRFT